MQIQSGFEPMPPIAHVKNKKILDLSGFELQISGPEYKTLPIDYDLFSAFWFQIIHFLPILTKFRHFPPIFTYIGPILTIFGNFSFFITWVS